MSKILCSTTDQVDLPFISVGQLMYDGMKRQDQDSTALVDLQSGDDLKYGDILRLSVKLAAALRALGIRCGDIIALAAENSHKFILPVLAGLYIGAPVHLLNAGYTPYELKHILGQSQPKLVFVSAKALPNVTAARPDLGSIETVVLIDGDVPTDGSVHLLDDLMKISADSFEIEQNIDVFTHVALICNSSGTTGLPKGVMITHEAFRLDLAYTFFPHLYKINGPETTILNLPFFHIYGFGLLKIMLYSGKRIFVMDEFSPNVYLKTVQDEHVGRLFIVPSLANFLAKSPIVDKYDTSSVWEMYSAAAPPCEEVYKLLTQKFKLSGIKQVYGLTEVSGAVCMITINESRDGSCGKLCPYRQLKIIDLETGQVLGANQNGEICLKGGIMKGYINNLEGTNAAIDEDGFFRTGDVGYYDDEGFIFIVDRLKDLIKYKSFQVAPVELEDILMQHPAVLEAGVVGKADERAGELPLAFVVKDPESDVTAQELIDFVAEHVSIQKRLHGGVRFISDIPKNKIGKILRKDLRQLLIECEK